MTEKELHKYLKDNYPKETSYCEWKEFKNLKHAVKGSAGDDIVSYISAISNMNGGHLIIGVKDNTLDIIGIQDTNNHTTQNLPLRLLGHCPNLSSEGLFVEEFITSDTNKRVWIIHIPCHLPRKPVLAHNKAWQRVEDSLIPIRKEREDAILAEQINLTEDWSAEICEDASIEDLSEDAIFKARENYINKFPKQAADVDEWDDIKFLNKAKICKKGKITNTAILLLGKPESEHFISPAVAKLRWILKEKNNIEKDYTILSCPFLLNVDEIYNKIRKIKYRYLKDGSLFPEEVDQYEPFVIREAINNSIAHQNYELAGQINVIENEDGFLVFSNKGNFIPGSIEKVINDDAPEEHYRNRFLVTAMFNLQMVDTIGSGIRRMFNYQRKRFFPMPDYELKDNRVIVTITGKILDVEYAKVLARHHDLSLQEIILLDKVQKKKVIDNVDVQVLKKRGLIEGRKPNYHVTATLAEKTGQKADYIKTRGFKDKHYKSMILEYIDKYGTATKKDLDKLILDILPTVLDEQQKKNKVRNLIYAMSNKDKSIKNKGTIRYPKWENTSKKP